MNTTNINDPKNANRTVEVILQNSQTIMIDQDKQYATMDKIKNEELFSMNKTTEINKYGSDDKIFQLPHIGPTLDVMISNRNPTCTKKTINYPKDKTSRVGKSNEKNKIKNNTEENYKLLKYLSSTFSGENNINNLLKTSFLCKDGDTLKKAIELSQSYSSDDHYKFLNGNFQTPINIFLYNVIKEHIMLSIQNSPTFTDDFIKFIKIELKLNVFGTSKKFKSSWKQWLLRKNRELKHSVSNIANDSVFQIFNVLTVLIKIKQASEFVHAFITENISIFTDLRKNFIEMYYSLKASKTDHKFYKKIIDIECIKNGFLKMESIYKMKTGDTRNCNLFEEALIYFINISKLQIDLENLSDVDINTNGIFSETIVVEKSFLYKISSVTFYKSDNLLDVVEKWTMMNVLCPDMKMNERDKKIYILIGAFTNIPIEYFCKNRSTVLPFYNILRGEILRYY